MKSNIKTILIFVLLFASILAVNTAITPILADDTETISACPAEPTCPPEPACPEVSACETCTDHSVMLLDVHLMLKPDPMRWEGTLTFPDGTEFLQTNYVDANAYFVGPEVAWPRNRTQGELEIFREEKEFRDACGNLVATGFEQGLFNLTSMEWNAFGEFDCMTEDFPLWDLEIVKTGVTGEVWIDDCDGWHAEGVVAVLYCDGTAASTCDTTEVIIADAHAIFMGEGVSGTGPFRWEGTTTFADGTVLTSIAYADPAPYFVGPDADWSLFGQGMQGELEIFREEMEIKDACGNIVATGYEQGIFNINTMEYNVKGESTVVGDAGPLTGKQVKKFFGTGEVWIDDCGGYHAEGCVVYLVCDAESACPTEPTCPEEPVCPTECPEEPVCPAAEETCEPNLVDVAIAVNSEGDYAGLFDTLIAAVLAADPAVVETLTGCDPYTVFAPTDDAFAALGLTPDTVGSVDQSLLTDILLYHVASGELNACTVLGMEKICTLKRATLTQCGGVLTDKFGRDATIIVTDVEACNGIIHVIDAVVLPCEAQALVE